MMRLTVAIFVALASSLNALRITGRVGSRLKMSATPTTDNSNDAFFANLRECEGVYSFIHPGG